MKEKFKAVFICHFSTEEMRRHLPLSNRRLYALARKIMGLPEKGRGYADIAPWDASFIKRAKERNDIELHVISAHAGLRKRLVSFEEDGVSYHFVNCDVATLLKYVIKDDDKWIRKNPMTPIVHKLINKINPDIVLLAGAENAYYSSTVLGLHNYPVFVLCQTVYNNPKFTDIDKKNATTEMRIFEQVNYCSVYCKEHYDLLRNLGYSGNVFFFRWVGTPMPEFDAVLEKKYDFINFAQHMSFDKGYPDSIKALAIVKRKYPNVKLNLIDGGTDVDRKELKSLINTLELQDNVSFTPFFKDQKDLFRHILNSRFAVLPCKVDFVSGTMLQSMYYGLPVVVYKTTGTPTFNEKRESVLIAEMNNVDELANEMLKLMDSPEKAEQLSHNAKITFNERWEYNSQIFDNMINDCRAIIANYREGTPIPKALSFENDNPDK